MTHHLCIPVSVPVLHALLDYQSMFASDMAPAGLAERAITEWLARQRAAILPPQQRGYFWKALFLPEGSRLRISNHALTRYAAIEGDELIYNAMSVSPNQFAQMTVGAARSAWHVIHVQWPGEREWALALRLRQALEAQNRHAACRDAARQAAAAPAPAPVPAAPYQPPSATLAAASAPFDGLERRKSYRRAEDLLLD